MAAILAAVARLAHERPRPLPTIIVSCTVDEENGFGGVRRLTDLWAGGGNEFIPRRPDAAIVLEPTGLNLVVAHKGVVRWRTHAHGRAAHSSRPEAGENAIYAMARAASAIEEYAAIIARAAAHPRRGSATVSVGTIHGGAGVNTVPDRCTIEIDCRPLPGEEPEAARRQLLDYVTHAASLDARLEHEPPYMQGRSLSDEHNGPLAERLAAVVRGVAGTCRQIGAPYRKMRLFTQRRACQAWFSAPAFWSRRTPPTNGSPLTNCFKPRTFFTSFAGHSPSILHRENRMFHGHPLQRSGFRLRAAPGLALAQNCPGAECRVAGSPRSSW